MTPRNNDNPKLPYSRALSHPRVEPPLGYPPMQWNPIEALAAAHSAIDDLSLALEVCLKAEPQSEYFTDDGLDEILQRAEERLADLTLPDRTMAERYGGG